MVPIARTGNVSVRRTGGFAAHLTGMNFANELKTLTAELDDVIGQMSRLQDRISEIVVAQRAESNEPVLLSVTAAAARIGVSRATLYRMIESGDAATVITGATKKVPVRWIEHHLAGGATEGGRIIEPVQS